jgi:uncharacterized protein (TIGR02246 family)
MAKNTKIFVLLLLGFGLIAALVMSSRLTSFVSAQTGSPAKPADEDAHAADRSAIQEQMKSFVAAFERGDAKALAAHWTAGGEYVGGDGTNLSGRVAIEKAYGELFVKNSKAKLDVEEGAARFTSQNAAIGEGYFKVRRDNEGASTGRYHILYVKEEGQWRIAVLRESPDEGASLSEIEWLIGDWETKSDEIQVRSSYKWWGNKSFIRMDFAIKEKDRTLSGFQMIGKDAATGELRSWTFEADGGYGEAVWSRDGKKWALDSAGVLSDGTTVSATNILIPIDDQSFTWQSTNRMVGGEEQPNIPPIRVRRVKEQK